MCVQSITVEKECNSWRYDNCTVQSCPTPRLPSYKENNVSSSSFEMIVALCPCWIASRYSIWASALHFTWVLMRTLSKVAVHSLMADRGGRGKRKVTQQARSLLPLNLRVSVTLATPRSQSRWAETGSQG